MSHFETILSDYGFPGYDDNDPTSDEAATGRFAEVCNMMELDRDWLTARLRTRRERLDRSAGTWCLALFDPDGTEFSFQGCREAAGI